MARPIIIMSTAVLIALTLLSLLLVSKAADALDEAQCAPTDDVMLKRVLDEELNSHVHELAQLSNSDVMMERFFLTPAWFDATKLLSKWMTDAGLRTWLDAMGNVHGRTPPELSNDAPVLMLGSHFDTVRDGGHYDGALGVMSGIAAAKAALLSLKDGELLARPLEVVGFGDEEGTRFFSRFLGSRALLGDVSVDELNFLKDANGTTLAEAMTAAGMRTDEETLAASAITDETLDTYIELHIEQGPVLESMDLPVAAIQAMVGSVNTVFEIGGKQGHAGTSRMDLRQDSLAGAAEAVVFIERLCVEHPRGKDDMLVCTVGRMEVQPNVSNVISGDVMFTVDVRCLSSDLLKEIVSTMKDEVRKITEKRGLNLEIPTTGRLPKPSTKMNKSVTQALVEASKVASATSERVFGPYSESGDVIGSTPPARGDDGKPRRVPILPSGAGHDAETMTHITKKVGMLWVRCLDGVSHSPKEYVQDRDISESATALFHYIRKELLGTY